MKTLLNNLTSTAVLTAGIFLALFLNNKVQDPNREQKELLFRNLIQYQASLSKEQMDKLIGGTAKIQVDFKFTEQEVAK